jgi:hypothetical protein
MERSPSALKKLGSCDLHPRVTLLTYPVNYSIRSAVQTDLCVHEIAGIVHKEIIHGLVIGAVNKC